MRSDVRARTARVIAMTVLAAAVAFACHTDGQPEATSKPDRLFDDLGDHHHPITTRVPLAQQWFDQGLRLAYGFNHDEARIAFYEGARLDPSCAMCWWGVAFTLGPNYNLPADPARAAEAWSAVEKARAAAPRVSEREQAYVAAIAQRYAPQPPADRRALDEAWAAAMADVAKRFPDDLDAATIHAEALMDLQPWDLWADDGTPKGRTPEIVAQLESVLARDPRHPGANHYYIHAVEASHSPQRGIPAADRLRALDIRTGHLVHMPSHIYVRTGRWADASQANERAVSVDEAYIARWDVQGPYPSMYYPHNVHFLSYAAGMEGRSAVSLENARKVATGISLEMIDHMAMLEGIAVAPLFATVRFERWDDALAEPRPAAKLRYANGLWHWMRGLAFAARGQPKQAADEARALDAIRTALPEDLLSTQVNTGKRLLGVASHHLAGTIAARAGRFDDAVKHLEAAVALEDSLVYMEPPDWFVPVRPTLAATLLAAGRAPEAEAVTREDLRRWPENGWALAGLAESLERQGKAAEARAVRDRLTKAWARADVPPPGNEQFAAGIAGAAGAP